MAKNVDQEFLNRLIENIKTEWMKNGEQPFEKSIDKFAEELFKDGNLEKNRNKVFNSIKRLENGCYIKIIRGKGSKTNQYAYVNENFNKEIIDTKEEFRTTIDNYLHKQNTIAQETTNILIELEKKSLAAIAEANNYKSALLELEFFAKDKEDQLTFIAKKGSNIRSIIDQLKIEQEIEQKKQTEETVE